MWNSGDTIQFNGIAIFRRIKEIEANGDGSNFIHSSNIGGFRRLKDIDLPVRPLKEMSNQL